MSKKNRHKKKNKQKIQKRVESFAPMAEVKETTEIKSDLDLKEESKSTSQPESIIDNRTRNLITKDVRMIIFTLLGLAIILTSVKFLQLKTNYIDNFSNWLYKIAHIQTM